MWQVQRVFPHWMPKAMIVQYNWRTAEDLTFAGWASIFGWNLAMFGYIGGVIFMFLLGWGIGACSGRFLRSYEVSGLLICYAGYCVLMQSYNSIGGDICHHLAIWYGLYLIFTARKTAARLRL